VSRLAKKLKLKPGARAALVNAPKGYAKELAPLPAGATLSAKLGREHDWIQLFAKDQAELKKLLKPAARALAPESLLWISFPKGSSNAQSDLTRDTGWKILTSTDLKLITLVSVNDTWSAFSMRPYREGEPKQEW
jgi:hypothetical protein